MAGSISTLGIGSGLQLQDILDKLRAVDQQVVDRKKTSITKYQSQLDEFTVVKNKLLTLKSAALNLSLSSSFTGRTVSSSSESVATATASDGATVKNSALTVTNLAQKSNWMSSSGVTSSDSIIYVPTSQVSSGVTDPVTGSIASAPGQLTIAFGASSTITVDVDNGTMLDDSGASGLSLVDLINNDLENAGKITASTYTVGSETFLRVETATPGGSGESNRIAISTNDTTLTFTPPNKLLTIQSGGKATSLSVAADTTLSQLVTQINNDTTNPGITASTINDGIDPANPYKLILTATSFGEEKRITFLTQLPDLAMAEQASQAVANSLNSQFTTDGIAYQRQTNSISDVITGVSLNLQGTGSSTITVTNNDDAIKEMIASLVTAYNDVVQEVKGKSGYDTKTENFGILSGTTLRDMPYDLQSLITSTNRADSGNNITSLFNLGLEFNRDGTISINDSTLTTTISTYGEGIQAFFLGDSDNYIEGFADKINNRLRTLTGASGLLEGEKTAAQTRIDDLNLKFAADSARLDKRYEQLTKQFVALDRYMNQMTSMSNFLTGQFNSLSDGWVGSSSNNE